jgi:polar amino acid transport system substrate-binding protein
MKCKGMKITIIFALFITIFLAGCVQSETKGEKSSTLKEITKREKLIVGTSSGYYPFHMKDKKGNFIGYDIDTAKAIADTLKVDIEFKYFSFDGLIPALQSEKVDIIIAGMTIRGDRALSVSFTNPYFSTGQVLMVPKKDASTKDWKDLDLPNKKIAVPIGTTGALLAKQLFKKATILDFDEITTAATAVMQGQADGLMYDEPGIRNYELMYPTKVRGIYQLISNEHLGIGVRSNDLETIQWLNSFIVSYKGSPAELASYNKWFQTIDWMSDVKKDN